METIMTEDAIIKHIHEIDYNDLATADDREVTRLLAERRKLQFQLWDMSDDLPLMENMETISFVGGIFSPTRWCRSGKRVPVDVVDYDKLAVEAIMQQYD